MIITKSILEKVNHFLAISSTDENGNIVYVNNKFCELTGFSREELIGNTHNILNKSEYVYENPYESLWDTISKGGVWSGVLNNYRKDGIQYLHNAIIFKCNELNKIVENSVYLSISTPVNSSILAEREKLKNIILSHNSEDGMISFLKLKHTKELIRAYGKENIVTLMQDVKTRIKKQMNQSDKKVLESVFYIDNGVFAFYQTKKRFKDSQFKDSIVKIKDKVLKLSYFIDKVPLSFDAIISFGFGRDCFEKAEIGMDEAEIKKVPIVVYTEPMYKKYKALIEKTIKEREEISYAIKSNKIEPFFQRIIDIANTDIQKYECLARLNLDGTIKTPNIFLPVAKELGITHLITRQMIRKVLFLMKDKENIKFSLNISLTDVEDTRTNKFILSSISKFPYPKNITFEILEDESLENKTDNTKLNSFISKLRNIGCGVALDDFGSGYANFGNILNIDIDTIKIDGGLIQLITTKKGYSIIKSIVEFAHHLGLKTVAEFIDNEEKFNLIKELKIDYSQGYFHHKPSYFLD